MARNRMINKEFWSSRSLQKVSRDARLVFIGLWTEADDEGRLTGDLRYLRNRIFPFGDVDDESFCEWMLELEGVGCIDAYIDRADLYICVPNFNQYQTISRPTKSRLPKPQPDTYVSLREYSMSHIGALPEHSIPKERKVKEGSGLRPEPEPSCMSCVACGVDEQAEESVDNSDGHGFTSWLDRIRGER